MKKFIQNKLKEQKGLTLIELLAVIVIIAIIAAIAIPAIGNIIENSRFSAVKSDGLNALAAANIYFAENPNDKYVSLDALSVGYLDSPGKLPLSATPSATNPTTKPASNFIEKGTNGLEITTGDITFSGSKKMKFTGATVTEINADNQKGSQVGTTTYDLD